MERSGPGRETRAACGGVRPWLRDEAGGARIDRVFPAVLAGVLVVVLAVSWLGQDRSAPTAAVAATDAPAEPERRVISSSSRGTVPVEPAEGEARGYVSSDYPSLQAPRADTERERLDAETEIARRQVVLPEPLPPDEVAAEDGAAEAGADGEAAAETAEGEATTEAAEGEATTETATDGS